MKTRINYHFARIVNRIPHLFTLKNATFVISLFVSLFSLSLYLENQNFEIPANTEVSSGIATFNNTDVTARVSCFYNSVFVFSLTFILMATILLFLKNRLPKLRMLFISLGRISWLGIFLTFFKFIKLVEESSFSFFWCILILLLVYELLRLSNKFKLFNESKGVFIWLISLSYSISFLLRETLIIFNTHSEPPFIKLFLICFTLIFTSILLLQQYTSIPKKALHKISLPVFIIPFLSILSDELYLILNQRNIHILSPNIFYIILIILTFSLFWFLTRKKNYPSLKTLLSRYIYPILLLTLTLFIHYQQFLPQPADLFELANPANGMMRLFQFGEIPIADALSSHVLSDFGFKPLYVLLNGWSGQVDFLLYDFLLDGIFIIVLYCFLKQFIRRADVVFILLIFFPYLPYILLSHHCLFFVSLYFVYRLFKHHSLKNLLLFGFWTFFLLVWKIEVGISAALGSFLIYFIFLASNRFRKDLLFYFLKTCGIVLLFAISLAGILQLTGSDIIGNFKQAIDYFGESQAHGYPDISRNYDRQYQLHYFIFPVISVLLTLFYFSQLFKSQNKNERLRTLSLIGLLLYYFMHAQRGLVRHSMIEGSEMFMSSWFYLIIGLSVYHLTSRKSYASSLFVISLTAIIFSFTFNTGKADPNLYQQLNTGFNDYSEVVKTQTKYCRVLNHKEFKNETYADFSDFMDENYEMEASFIDFSNSPMLYFYTNRQVPSYFNQYMQNTVSKNLQLKNIEKLSEMNIPVVVYSHLPEEWWDNTDNVPNRLRYYFLSQYIYLNYQPAANINNYYIWVKTGEKPSIKADQSIGTALIEEAKADNLKLFPLVLSSSSWFNEDFQELENWKNTYEGTLSSYSKSEKLFTYIKIIISPHQNDKKYRFTYHNEKELGRFIFNSPASDQETEYIIPISSQYNWISLSATKWKLTDTHGNTINAKEVILFKTPESEKQFYNARTK